MDGLNSMPVALTLDELNGSSAFKQFRTSCGRIAVIFNLEPDSGSNTFLALTSDMGRWTFTRFWKTEDGGVCSVVDHENISTEESFKVLLGTKGYSEAIKSKQ